MRRSRIPGRIGVSLDLRDGRPALDGWLRTGTADAVELARQLVDAGAARLIVTDTARDGTLAGPNLALLADAASRAARRDARGGRRHRIARRPARAGRHRLRRCRRRHGAPERRDRPGRGGGGPGGAGVTLRKRIIACLDVTDGRVVKGTRFVDLVDAGDPVELAARYGRGGRRRDHDPRHRRHARRPAGAARPHLARRGRARRAAGGRRWGPQRRRRGGAARRRRGQGGRELGRAARSDAGGAPGRPPRVAVGRRGHRRRSLRRRRGMARARRSPPRRRRGATPWRGRARRSSAAPASCW